MLDGEPQDSSDENGAPSGLTPKNRGLARDIAWTYASAAAAALAALLIPAIVVRLAGTSAFGAYSFVAAATSLATPFDAALSIEVVRAVARMHRRDAEDAVVLAAYGSYIRLVRVIVALVGGLIVLLLTHVIAVPATSPKAAAALVAVVGAGVAVTLGTSTHLAVITGSRRFRTIAASATFGSALSVLAVIPLVRVHPIVGLAFAILVGTTCTRLSLYIAAKKIVPWLTLRAARSSALAVKSKMWRRAIPIVLIGVSGQLLATTDLFVIGLLSSASSVGVYRVASLLPVQGVALLFRGFDAILPTLAAEVSADRQEQTVVLTSRVFSLAGGGMLGTLILLREDVTEALLGRPSEFAPSVLAILAGLWAINMTVHGLALLLFSRERQHILTPVVLGEVSVNAVLTVILVKTWGPTGAAWASALVIAVSNLIVFPLIIRRETQTVPPWKVIARDGLLAMAVGFTMAFVGFAATGHISGVGRLALAATVTAVLCGLAVPTVIGTHGRQRLRALLIIRRVQP